jgi:Coenzyme PQQ synthesis protein D (PqqD)
VPEIKTHKLSNILGRLRQLAGNIRLGQRSRTADPLETGWANRRLAAAPEVRVSNHGDGLALLHIPTGKVFVCNRTASQIWQGLQNGFTPEAISGELSREAGVGRELVHQHTSAFVAELKRRRLVIRRVED